MKSTFHARWLARSEVSTQVLFTSQQAKKNKMAFVGILEQAQSLFGMFVYTKTIIHLSVGESDGCLPPLQCKILS